MERITLRFWGTLVRRVSNGAPDCPTGICPRRVVWSSRRMRVTSPVSPVVRHCRANRAIWKNSKERINDVITKVEKLMMKCLPIGEEQIG